MQRMKTRILAATMVLSAVATTQVYAASDSGTLSMTGGNMACHASVVCHDRIATATTSVVPNESSRCYVYIMGVSQGIGKKYMKENSSDNYHGEDVSVSVTPDTYAFDYATSNHIVSYGSSTWSTSLLQRVTN